MDKSKTRPSKENRSGGDVRSVKEVNIKKAVQDAMKVLHDLSGGLADADAILNAARDTTVTVASLQESVRKLEDEATQSKQASQQLQKSFADDCLSLTREYQSRCSQLEQKYQMQLVEDQTQTAAEVAKLRSDLDTERQKNQSLTQKLASLRADLEGRLEKERNGSKKDLEARQRYADQLFDKAADAEKKIAAFRRDIEDQRTIIQGHDKEKEILQRQLAVYEAFETFDMAGVRSTLEALRQGLNRFAESCVDKADLLPEWNRVPEGLHRDGLPQLLNMSTPEGQQMLVALIRNAVVTELTSRIFVPAPSCCCNEMNAISGMMHAHDPALEAVWRQMTAAAVLREPRMQAGFRSKLKKTADHLIATWKLPLTEKSRGVVQQQLLSFLCECQDQWLKWMRFRERLTVARTGPAAVMFTHETSQDFAPVETESKLPGDFTAASRPDPILCVFPAVFRSSAGGTAEKVDDGLVFKGEAIYPDSPTLIKVVSDARGMASPRVARN